MRFILATLISLLISFNGFGIISKYRSSSDTTIRELSNSPSILIDNGIGLCCRGFEFDFKYGSNSAATITINDSVSLTIHMTDKYVNADIQNPFFQIEIISGGKKHESVIFEPKEMKRDFLALRILDNVLSLGVEKFEKEVEFPHVTDIESVSVKAVGKVSILRSIIYTPSWRPEIVEGFESVEHIREMVADNENIHIWQFFDEEIDLKYSMLGGEYTLATFNDNGDIDLIYVSGAKIYPGEWHCGMLKAVATPTAVSGVYNLKWTDAEFNNDVYRAFMKIEGNVMELTFPYDSAKLRFVKIKSI